jgi:SAM-dependent methyltransferase
MRCKSEFYESNHSFYFKTYWNCKNDSLWVRNGFNTYPFKIYTYFESIINELNNNKVIKVIDLGCGNGLLLKHIVDSLNCEVIPYGVDFLIDSIKQAQKIIHPKFANNFVVANFIDYDYENAPFDFTLVDPYHIHENDLFNVVQKIANKTNIALIFYSYADVLNELNYSSITSFPVLEKLSLQVFSYKEISIGVMRL